MLFYMNKRRFMHLRKAGDRSRDARDWEEAADTYQAYLAKVPGDYAIHVQHGHVLKEAGRIDEADKAYARALALRSDDADLLLNYARLLKKQNRLVEARKMLGLSIAHGYTHAAFHELRDIADERIQETKYGQGLESLTARFIGLKPTRALDVDLDANTGSMTLQGGDPWVMIAVDDSLRVNAKAGILRFVIRSADPEGEPPHPVIYLDYGDGMSEDFCCVPVVRDGGYAIFIVRPDLLKAIRWDPNDRESELVFERAEFESIMDEAGFNKAIEETSPEFYTLPEHEDYRDRILNTSKMSAHDAVKLQRVSPSNFTTAFNYDLWIKMFDTPTEEDKLAMKSIASNFKIRPRFSFVMPVYNPPIAFLAECIDSMLAQNYPHFEICIADDASTDQSVQRLLRDYAKKDDRIKLVLRERNGHISAASNDALAMATGDFIALVDHDDLVAPHALFTMARYLNVHPDAKVLFSDEDKVDIEGNRSNPYFKTCYNRFLMYGHNMVTHLGVYSLDLVQMVGGFREGFEGSQDYDLILRCAEQAELGQIIHVPHVLYHWRMIPGSTAIGADQKNYAIHAARTALNGHFERTASPFRSVVSPIPGTSAVARTGAHRGKISIILPTRNGLDVLEPCVNSILANPCEDIELLIIDNGSDDPATLLYMINCEDDERIRVLRYPKEFNYSLINNFGAQSATGDIVCLLNNDTEVLSPNWLDRARLLLSLPEVGIVGARLYYPDMTLQHFGTALGMGRDAVAGHIGLGTPRGVPGHFNRSALIGEFSAVTAACLFVRKSVFDEVGGLDPNLKVAFNDVDLCLKVRAAGYLVIADPEIELIHKESRTRGSDQAGEKRKRFLGEVQTMHRKWGDLLRNDPYYSPNHSSLRLDFALAYPPRVARPWSADPA